MPLTIIIPTHNGKQLLQDNLPSIYKALKNIKEWEVVVVDNNSKDNTEKLLDQYRNIKFIKLQKNYGFTGAVNCAAKKAKGEYLLILNNDCSLEKNTIENMIDFLKSNINYVVTQPIVYKGKTKEIENIGYLVNLTKGKAEPVKDENFYLPTDGLFKNSYFYGLSATCLLIKRNVFIKVGMFDEKFHSYLEDVDLFIRLAKLGYKYYPTLRAKCYHEHMATSSKMGNYKEKQDFKNWIRIICKNYPIWFIILHFPTLFIERLRNLSGLVKKTVKILSWM